MTIKQIYDKFGTPPNLQEHMIRVAKVVAFIRDHWIAEREAINWNEAITAALLHDLGNLVRFKIFYCKTQEEEDFWKKRQTEMIEIYGNDDHEATKTMLTEIGISKEIIDTVLLKSFGNSIEIVNSNNWPRILLAYADLRTVPEGIKTMAERIDDITNRLDKYKNRPDLPQLIEAAHEIESQIQKNINVPASEITDQSIESSYDFLAIEV